VYVGLFAYGSPANAFTACIRAGIMEVDGVAHPESGIRFLKAPTGPARSLLGALKDPITWNNAPESDHAQSSTNIYWPAYELTRTSTGGLGAARLE